MKDRINKLKGILQRTGYRSVGELAEELEVSEMTIRRYLDQLEEQDLVTRTHGGAYIGEEMIDVDYRVRETLCRPQKEAIGRVAASLIESGESIFIDTGSTAAYVALAIDGTKRITVVTTSIVVAETLERKPNVETILLGGRVHAPTHSVQGPIAQEVIKQFRFSKAFIAAVGIDVTQGLTQGNLEEVPVKQTAAANAKQTIAVLDSSKFNRQVLVMLLPIDEISMLVTDDGVSPEDRAALEERGVEVRIARPVKPEK